MAAPGEGDDGPLIYLVDDDPIVQRFVRKALESEGFRVEIFSAGVEFLEALPDRRPDLVLLDLRMPILSGEALLETVRGRMDPQGLRVLLYSSAGVDELADLSIRYRTNGYVSKSTTAEDLTVAIRKALTEAPSLRG